MRSALIKVALAAVLPLLMTACRPTENSENKQANSPAQPAATAVTTPAVISGSVKSSANENAGPAQGNSGEVTAEVKSELSTATRELLGIMLRGETNEAAGRLTDDFKNTRPDGTVEDKTQYLAHLKPFPDFNGFIFDKFKVESLEGDTAVVTGLVQVGGKGKDSYLGNFRETFVKRQGKWLLQSAQNTEPKLSN
jgi:hypothetical protein